MGNILITGVNGFVGNYLYNQFKEFNNVYGLDINQNSEINKMLIADISNYKELSNALEDIDVDFVIHCAAIAHNDNGKYKYDDFNRVNVLGTENLINALSNKKIVRFFLFSSVSVYGENSFSKEITETSQNSPKTDYARSKLAAEILVREQNYFKYYILRMPVIYSLTFLKDIYKRFFSINYKKGSLILKPGSGKQQHTFCSIINLHLAILQLLNFTNSTSEILQIGDFKNYTTNDLISYFKKSKKITFTISIPISIIFIVDKVFTLLNISKFSNIYCKLCQNNIYSVKKIKELGINLKPSFLIN